MDAAKKDCILLQAARAFSRFGFKKASIDDIAREAGVGKGTVYLAADSKEDLFYQVLHREVRAWQSECARTIDPRVPADQLLGTLLTTAMQHVERHPLVLDLLLGETLRALPDWSERLEGLREVGRANVVEVLRIGVRQELFRADLEIDTVASLLQDFQLAAYRGLEGSPSRAREVEARVRVGLDLVLHGLCAR
ncbi:MAG: helix-turn-helix transcriptional regulator [Myxococcales bacterium]|nr:helix-turn-helix transcriptional regulator [Myxococcales bacterium]HQY62057.1 TetR/AcrR family transcriptional regulator [Polyangiaceae bacterium]